VRPKCSFFDNVQNSIPGGETGNLGEDLFFTFTPPSVGDYYLLVESDAFTSSQLYELKLENSSCIPTEVRDIDIVSDFNVYPNPADDIIYIDFGQQPIQNTILRIYDITGVLYFTLPINSQTIELSIQGIPKGMFFLEMELNNSKVIKKMIKQ
ncbi:MAG: hypothetical protein ACI85O_003226, partial [Saprospiraceae bacterium]